MPFLNHVDAGQIVVDLGIIRSKRESVLKRLGRQIILFQVPEQHPDIVLGLEMTGFSGKGQPVFSQRLILPVEKTVDVAQLKMIFGPVRFYFNGLFEKRDALFWLVQISAYQCGVEKGLGLGRTEQEAPVKLYSCRLPVFLSGINVPPIDVSVRL
jgi:hypothetical protein